MSEAGPFNGLFTVPDTQFTLPAWNSDRKAFASTASSPTTFTVPIGMVKGFSCVFVQQGAGALTIAAGTGVTINTPGTLTAAARYTMMWLQSVDQDIYVLNQGS
jgi:hypothetical protein